MFSGIRYFNHHAGCQKCDVRGKSVRRSMCFPPEAATLRTNDSFRLRTDPAHHIKYSIIEELIDFDIVLDFPVCDPLHLLHIGLDKKMLNRWLNGTKTYKKIISNTMQKQFDELLRMVNLNKPTEINRPIRMTKDFSRWKATEHRTMLLYAGIVILKNFTPHQEYELFLCLCIAVKLASVDSYIKENNRINLIKNLLENFVKTYSEIYGQHTISSNVHYLCHLSADLERFGNIDSVSTYPFENHLGKIQNKIRAYHNPLQQFAKRVGELEQVQSSIDIKAPAKNRIELKFPENDSYQTVLFNGIKLSSRNIGDSWFLLKSTSTIIKFEKAVKVDGNILIYGKEITDKNNFFEYIQSHPFDSKHIDIYLSDCMQKNSIVCKADDIKCKLFRLPYDEKYVFQPLLHTI